MLKLIPVFISYPKYWDRQTDRPKAPDKDSLQISNTLFHTILASILLFMLLLLKILSGMANSVDPDQEQSDHGLHCLHMSLCQTLWFLKF